MNEQTGKQQAHPILLRWESFGVGLLLLTLFGALGIPEWLVLVTGVSIPWLDNDLPYLAPLLLAIMIFNTLVASRLNGGRILVLPESLLLILFVVVAFAIELGHVVMNGGEVVTRLHLSLFWMVVYYLALHSFHPILLNCRAWTVTLAIGMGFGVAVLDVLTVVVFSPAWGAVPFGLDPSQLFDSTFVAYLTTFAFALVLFEHTPRTRTGVWGQYALVAPVLAWATHLQRLVGPDLLLLALLGLKGLTLIRSNRSRILALIGILVPLAAGMLYNLGNAHDPTLAGLGGGTYFFDEIGIVHGDIISSYIRRETILEELRLFLDSPLLGVGMGRASEVKILMFGTHSNLVYILAATGLLGFSLFVLPLAWATFRALRERGLQALALPMIVLGAMLLAPRVMWWWAVAMYLLSSRPDIRPQLRESFSFRERAYRYLSLLRFAR